MIWKLELCIVRIITLGMSGYSLRSIKHGGLPIIARGGSGNIAMVRHLKKGGFFALLVDQR